jgi:hypothetical protein
MTTLMPGSIRDFAAPDNRIKPLKNAKTRATIVGTEGDVGGTGPEYARPGESTRCASRSLRGDSSALNRPSKPAGPSSRGA